MRDNFKKIKKAFTLAEALIVVAVIGVIAALTVPAVVNNYQKEAFATHLKKIANDFTSATTVATVNRGKPSFRLSGVFCLRNNCSRCEYCDAFMSEYMSAERQDNIFNSSYRSISGSSSNFNCAGRTYRLPSGAAICMTQKSQGDMVDYTTYHKPYFQIDVDLNGTDGPNISGRDYFKFFIDYTGKVIGSEDMPDVEPSTINDCIMDATLCPEWGADVNGDGEINIADVNVITEINNRLNNFVPPDDNQCTSNSRGLYCFDVLRGNNWKMDY